MLCIVNITTHTRTGPDALRTTFAWVLTEYNEYPIKYLNNKKLDWHNSQWKNEAKTAICQPLEKQQSKFKKLAPVFQFGAF